MAVKFLSEIIQTIRDRGDFRNPTKFTDAIITKEAQAAFAELYQLIAGVQEGYFDIYATLTTRATADFVALPSDGWRVRAIDILDSAGCPDPLDQVGIDQRNNYGIVRAKPEAYRLTQRGIDLYPPPDAAYSLRVLYTPSAPNLSTPVFVGSSEAAFASLTATVTTPSGVLAGDTMLIVVVGGTVTSVPAGWHSVLTLTSTALVKCTVLRRTADGAEDTTYAVVTSVACGVTMLAYRNLDPTADIVDSAITDVTASVTYPCQSLTLEAVSDLYLGITSTTNGVASFAPPFASVERVDDDTKIAAFDLQPGAIGATGAKTALASAARTGAAVALALKVNPGRDYLNGWEEYIIYGAMVRLSGEEEAMRGDWKNEQLRARAEAERGATGRRSAEPQLIPLLEDGW